MSRIRTNALYSVGYQVVRLLFPLITYPYVARILGPTGVGSVSYTASIAAMFGGIALMGIPVYGTREISRVRDDPSGIRATNSDLMVLSFALSVVATALFLALPLFGRFHVPDIRLHLLFVVMIIANPAKLDWYFQGTEQYRFTTLRNLVVRLISAAGIFVLVRDDGDVLGYGFLWVLGTILGAIVNLWIVLRNVGFELRIRRALGLARKIGPSAAIVLIGYLYTGIDTVMLGNLVDDAGASVGYYAIVGRMLRIIGTIIAAATTVVVPRISLHYGRGDHSQVDRLISRNFEVALFLAVPASIGIFLTAPSMVALFGGPRFIPAIPTMQIMAIQLVMMAIGAIVSSQVLYARDRERHLIVTTAVSLVAAVVLNYLLIPGYTHVGAAVGTTIARLIEVGMQVAFGWTVVRTALRTHRVRRVALAAAIWAVVAVPAGYLLPVNASAVGLAVYIVAVACLYAVIAFLIRVPIVDDLWRWIVSKRADT